VLWFRWARGNARAPTRVGRAYQDVGVQRILPSGKSRIAAVDTEAVLYYIEHVFGAQNGRRKNLFKTLLQELNAEARAPSEWGGRGAETWLIYEEC